MLFSGSREMPWGGWAFRWYHKGLRRVTVAKNPSAFSVNERIQHEDYGPGTITNIGPLHTTIEFDQVGTKKFMSSMVRLERTDVAAPQRRARAATGKSGARSKKAAK